MAGLAVVCCAACGSRSRTEPARADTLPESGGTARAAPSAAAPPERRAPGRSTAFALYEGQSVPETLRGFCTAAWDPSVAREPAAGGTPVEARVLVSQNNSNFQVPMVCRITTAAEWEAFRREAAWTGIPPLPEVDFGRTVLLAAAQGWKSSTGYRIDIARVRARGDTLEAVVQPHEPPDGSTVGAEETSPVVVVALGARRSDVRFVWPVR